MWKDFKFSKKEEEEGNIIAVFSVMIINTFNTSDWECPTPKSQKMKTCTDHITHIAIKIWIEIIQP